MFERFTDSANRTIELAQREARELRKVNVGSEDLLVALLQLEDDIPAQALARLGVSLETVRSNVEKMHFSAATWRPHGDVPFTGNAKMSLQLALREALQLGHDYIGTEHLLLGIIRHDSDTVSDVYGIYPGNVRRKVISLVMERNPTKAEIAASEEVTFRSSADISAEIDTVTDWLHELETELNAAIKRETGCDPSYHH